jgi:exopolyphosphatase / guanosine-5'-triphosphate,3'-diphosphate pyrophosphatase
LVNRCISFSKNIRILRPKKDTVRYGAIDIGTNAARLLVGEVCVENGHTFVKKISYTRIPLRLGLEVFDCGKISKQKTRDFIKTIQAFRLISEIFDVKKLRACATSAMRDAENGLEVKAKIAEETGVEIEIIEGVEEADLIFGTFFLMDIAFEIPFLVIDVGGGSTEISIFENGKKIAAKSFDIGTIRILKGKVSADDWEELTFWLIKNVDQATPHRLYGTGGNINKIHKIAGCKDDKPLLFRDLSEMQVEYTKYSAEAREERFHLKPDRADVIVPAAEIYLHIMKLLKSKEISVPKIGLSDGIIYDLFLKDQKAEAKKRKK